MSHTYAHNLVHCVFSTKGRRNLIRNPEELWRYVVGLAYAKEIHVVTAGGNANHLHLLALLPQTMTLSKAMQDVKAIARVGYARHAANFGGRKDTVRSA